MAIFFFFEFFTFSWNSLAICLSQRRRHRILRFLYYVFFCILLFAFRCSLKSSRFIHFHCDVTGIRGGHFSIEEKLNSQRNRQVEREKEKKFAAIDAEIRCVGAILIFDYF